MNLNFEIQIVLKINAFLFQSTLDVDGVVAKPGEYVFVVHFFSPDNVPITATVLVQNERFG